MNSRLKKYLVVGISAFVFEMFIIYAVHNLLGYGSVVAVGVSYWIGLLVTFILQKFITFENYHRKIYILGRQFVEYGILVIFNYLFSLLLVYILNKYISVYIIRTIAIAITTLWNYVIYKRIFREHADK